MTTKKILILAVAALALATSVKGQTNFSRAFSIADDSDANVGFNIQQFEDGFLVLAARANILAHEYFGLAKVGQDGLPEWRETYYLENQDKPPDAGLNMVVDDLNIYVACQYADDSTDLDWQLLCINRETRDTVWTQKYPRLLNDYILQTLETADNALLMVGAASLASGKDYLRIIKADKSGNILWEKLIDTFKAYYPWQACIAQDGAVLIAYNGVKSGEFHLRGGLIKVDLSGEIVWDKHFNQSESPLIESTVTTLPNGDIAMGWVRDTFAPGGAFNAFPPTIFILDSMGNTKSEYAFYHYNRRLLYTLRTLPNGDLLGIGTATGHPDTLGDGGWLFRMSPTGELIWQRAITDQRFDNSAYLLDAINTPDGGILATGYIRPKQPGQPWQVWMLKISGNGCYESDCENFELFITPSIEAPVSMPQYSLFPNPASNEVYIEGLTGADEQQVDIYNEQGQLIQSISSPRSGPIFTGDWPAGVYSFKLLLKNNLFTTLQLLKR